MKNNAEAAPFIHTVGDAEVKNDLYLKYFAPEQLGNLKGTMPICGVDFQETEASYAKRLRDWRFADRAVIFDDWIVKDMKHWHHVTNAEGSITMLFEFKTYEIANGQHVYKFPVLPETIDDFINDCKRIGLKLFWKKEIIDKFGEEKITSTKKVIEYHKMFRQTLD